MTYLMIYFTSHQVINLRNAFLGNNNHSHIKYAEVITKTSCEWMIYRDISRAMGLNYMDSSFVNFLFEAVDWIRKLFGKPEANRQRALMRMIARGGKTSYAELEKHPHGMNLTKGKQPDIMKEIRTKDKKVHLNVPEFLASIDRLILQPPVKDPNYPFILSTTCRTMANVNTIMRNQKWRDKHMQENSVTINDKDAETLGVKDNERVRMSSRTGSAEVPVSVSNDVMQGTVYLSHGWGLYSRDPNDKSGKLIGTTAALFLPDDEGDEFTGLPFYSGIPCRIEKI